ncbi:C40 family peptidase [Cytophagaceae bacterium ABcell3]|nr:C40 family peptidase [Cytophagaceae bacterium ABcell3]
MRKFITNIRIVPFFILLAFLSASCKSTKSTVQSGPGTTTDKVIQTAKSYVGTKYKYGGTSRSGIDCSGLVLLSFKSAGIQLPRTSAEQSQAGKKVKLSKLQKGDLVFFSAKKRSRKITHVGIVTERNGPKDIKFIHASTKAGVIEADLYAPYYISIFKKAVRVL